MRMEKGKREMKTPKTPSIPNRAARDYVQRREEFQGSHTFARCKVVIGEEGEVQSDLYIVYSYGEHFPMFIAETDVNTQTTRWYENTDKWSRTTSKHYGQLHPHVECMVPMDTDRMKLIARGGLMELVRRGLQ